MAAESYRPSRDRMRLIQYKATTLRRTFVEWWKDSRLPGFPSDIGSHDALKEMFVLDCALNPDRLAWEHPERLQPSAQVWSARTVAGLYWVRILLDILIERAGVRSLAEAWSFEAWINSNPTHPEGVSIQREELKALGQAIERMSGDFRYHIDHNEPDLAEIERRLYHVLSRNAGIQSVAPKGRSSPLPEKTATSVCPIRVIAPGVKPQVGGGADCGRLSKAQYDVLRALIEAFPGRLIGRKLVERSKHEDAVNILKGLKERYPDTLGRFIHLPSPGGCGYRVGFPQHPQTYAQKPTEEPAELAEVGLKEPA